MYKVTIRPLQVQDASTSYKWRNDPEIWQYTGSKPNKVITEQIEQKWIEDTLNDKTKKRFAIEVDNIYVGNIQLTNINHESAEYHIFIGQKEYWNKGIAKLASAQIIKYAKEVLELKEIYLYVNSLNIYAIKAYKALGFKVISPDIKMILKLN